jgi:hypothetical protein
MSEARPLLDYDVVRKDATAANMLPKGEVGVLRWVVTMANRSPGRRFPIYLLRLQGTSIAAHLPRYLQKTQ